MVKDYRNFLNRIKAFETEENIMIFNSEYGNLWPLFKLKIINYFIYEKKNLRRVSFIRTLFGALFRGLNLLFKTNFRLNPDLHNDITINELWLSRYKLRFENKNSFNKYMDPYFNKFASEKALIIENNENFESYYLNENLRKGTLIRNINSAYLIYNLKNIYLQNKFGFRNISRKFKLDILSKNFNHIDSYDLFITYCNFAREYNFYKYLLGFYPNLEKVVLTCYYCESNLAVISAANSLNIGTVDLQHGVISSEHFAYGNWSFLRKNIFQLFPSTYYVYSNKEKDILMDSFNNLCEVKVIGNESINKWVNNNFNFSEKSIILYTLQNDIIEKNSFILKFLEYINIYYPQYVIMFRIHPRHKYLKNAFDIELKSRKFSYQWDENDEIYETLSKSILHITATSSVVEDALRLNIPSFIIQEFGGVFYNDLIQNSDLVSLVLTKKDAKKEFIKLIENK